MTELVATTERVATTAHDERSVADRRSLELIDVATRVAGRAESFDLSPRIGDVLWSIVAYSYCLTTALAGSGVTRRVRAGVDLAADLSAHLGLPPCLVVMNRGKRGGGPRWRFALSSRWCRQVPCWARSAWRVPDT